VKLDQVVDAYIMKECRIVFSDEFANEKSSSFRKKYGYFKNILETHTMIANQCP
jgi:hypothetical protein